MVVARWAARAVAFVAASTWASVRATSAQSAQVIYKNTSTLGLLLGTCTAAPSIVVNDAWLAAASRGLGAPLLGVLALHAAEATSSSAAAIAANSARGPPR